MSERNGSAKSAATMEMIGGKIFDFSKVEQLIWLKSSQTCLVCFKNGSNQWVKGPQAVAAWDFGTTCGEFQLGRPGCRLVRPYCFHLL